MPRIILTLEVSMGEYSLDDYQAMNHTAWAETLYQSDLTIQDTEIVGVRVED